MTDEVPEVFADVVSEVVSDVVSNPNKLHLDDIKHDPLLRLSKLVLCQMKSMLSTIPRNLTASSNSGTTLVTISAGSLEVFNFYTLASP